MIRLAIADDEILFRNGLVRILEDYEKFEIVYTVGSGDEFLEKFKTNPIVPDICLLDLRMKSMDGIETTKHLNKLSADVKIIILTSYYSPSFVKYMVKLGVNAFLPKLIQPEELKLAIDTVYEKGLYLTQDFADAIRSKSQQSTRPFFEIKEYLTKKEKEVLYWICHGLSNQEISDKVFRSIRTIEGHRQHILDKTGAKNTAGLVVYALMNNIIDMDEKFLKESMFSI
ncbi:response regulator transcription factor [Mesonia sp. K4-1]|jgi:DNA-binding NarL/FixJ family response regulator|uniref:response regulator transcription factor n=1 Tax=Mesonia sp. K4-1 TaxID=2602760 RepID=UPI0011CC37AD|nr:response regulator transcription factor [Mesonia sp. K4-1]TXK71951.1 response regulator transcription factor [Mesonia sp. K4-1]